MIIHHSRWSDADLALRVLKVLGALLLLLALSACFATHTAALSATSSPEVPGFWRGFWHGIIAPIAFLVGLFKDDAWIYAVPNAGRWYDFGFMLGIGGFSGGLFAGSKGRRSASGNKE